MLAQELLEDPLMSNHARGLWGYVGATAEGGKLTVQSTGIGGPSLAIVVSELAGLGLRRAVRIDTCAALKGGLEVGAVLVAGRAHALDGVSRSIGATGAVGGPGRLSKMLAAEARSIGWPEAAVASVDVPGLAGQGPALPEDAAALDMGTAPLFALGERLGIEVAALLIVSEARARGPEEVGEDALSEVAAEAGRAALRTLSR